MISIPFPSAISWRNSVCGLANAIIKQAILKSLSTKGRFIKVVFQFCKPGAVNVDILSDPVLFLPALAYQKIISGIRLKSRNTSG
jgi:hypothetical protein